MTLNHENNHTSGISAFKLVKNEVLHKILWLFCQKLKIQYGRLQSFWFNANKHMKEENETSPQHQILFYICWMKCVQNCITLSGFKLSNVLWRIPQGQGEERYGQVRALLRRVHISLFKQKKQVVLTGRFRFVVILTSG